MTFSFHDPLHYLLRICETTTGFADAHFNLAEGQLLTDELQFSKRSRDYGVCIV